MAMERELYHVLEGWMIAAQAGEFDRFKEFRDAFGPLEEAVFGEVGHRNNNPLARLYDLTRNNLVQYGGCRNDPELGPRFAAMFLAGAQANFSKIKKPE